MRMVPRQTRASTAKYIEIWPLASMIPAHGPQCPEFKWKPWHDLRTGYRTHQVFSSGDHEYLHWTLWQQKDGRTEGLKDWRTILRRSSLFSFFTQLLLFFTWRTECSYEWRPGETFLKERSFIPISISPRGSLQRLFTLPSSVDVHSSYMHLFL